MDYSDDLDHGPGPGSPFCVRGARSTSQPCGPAHPARSRPGAHASDLAQAPVASAVGLDAGAQAPRRRVADGRFDSCPVHRDDLDWFLTSADPRGRGPPCVMQANRTPVPMAVSSPSGGLHRHEHDGCPTTIVETNHSFEDSRAVGQGREVRAELDSAVVPSVRGQPGETVSVHSGVQPWALPSPIMPAQDGQALVAAERAGQADQDGRPSGAKLRENATTILPRGRALQGVGLSSMRFHPTGGGPEDDKDGQVAWLTARTASLIR